MMKNLAAYLFTLFISLVCLFQPSSVYAMTGTGTEEDPYIIEDINDLQAMNNELTAYYELGTNIDASDTVNWNEGAGFAPIGSQSNSFKGGFNGAGYIISDLYINRPSEDVGLFGYSTWESDYIRNVGVVDAIILGGYRTGALGARIDSPVSQCFATGTIEGLSLNSVAGGLIAQCHDIVENCYARVEVTAVYKAAGFVSFNNGEIVNCYSTGQVLGAADIDGFVNEATGHGGGIWSSSFWDMDTSGVTVSDAGTGKTLLEMLNVATYTDSTTTGLDFPWDFEGDPFDDLGSNDYWDIDLSSNDGYPFLTVIVIEPTPTPTETPEPTLTPTPSAIPTDTPIPTATPTSGPPPPLPVDSFPGLLIILVMLSLVIIVNRRAS